MNASTKSQSPIFLYSAAQVFFGSLLCSPLCGALMTWRNLIALESRLAAAPLIVIPLFLGGLIVAPSVLYISDQSTMLMALAGHVLTTLTLTTLALVSFRSRSHEVERRSRLDAILLWAASIAVGAAFILAVSAAALVLQTVPRELESIEIESRITVQYEPSVEQITAKKVGKILIKSGVFGDAPKSGCAVINGEDSLEVVLFWDRQHFTAALQPYLSSVANYASAELGECLVVSARDHQWQVLFTVRSDSCP